MKSFTDKRAWDYRRFFGHGRGPSSAFAQQGATLILSARRMEELEREKKCRAATVELLLHDLANPSELAGKVRQVIEIMGRVDILINNTGVY